MRELNAEKEDEQFINELKEIEERIKEKEDETLKEIEKEIKDKNIKIPKTNQEFINEFRKSIEKYMSYGAINWEDIENTDFYLRFNGITDTNGFHIVGRKDLEEYIIDELNEYRDTHLNHISNANRIFNDLLDIKFDDILTFATFKYAELIFHWTENIIFDGYVPSIEDYLVTEKETILKRSYKLPIYNFLKENFQEVIKIIAQEIYNFRTNSNTNR